MFRVGYLVLGNSSVRPEELIPLQLVTIYRNGISIGADKWIKRHFGNDQRRDIGDIEMTAGFRNSI